MQSIYLLMQIQNNHYNNSSPPFSSIGLQKIAYIFEIESEG